MEDTWGDDGPLTSGDFGDWSSSHPNKFKLTQEETFKRLEFLDDELIETYLRKKKIKKIKKNLDI